MLGNIARKRIEDAAHALDNPTLRSAQKYLEERFNISVSLKSISRVWREENVEGVLQPVLDPEEVRDLATTNPRDLGLSFSRWSVKRLHQYLGKSSPTTVWRCIRDNEIPRPSEFWNPPRS
jgi:hypothetical protein